MHKSKDVNQLAKEYVERIKLGRLNKKNVPSKSRVIQSAFYHGYYEALRKVGVLPNK